MSEETQEKKGIVVKLVIEPLLDKKGEVVNDPRDNEPLNKRHDAVALTQMLNGIDTRKYDFKALKAYSNLKEKIDEAWLKDKAELELTLDQAAFLKEYLENLNSKTNAQTFSAGPFHIRTMIAVKEQLDD